MANFEIPEEVEFNSELRMIETTDRAHADLFNGMFGQLLSNEVQNLKVLAKPHLNNFPMLLFLLQCFELPYQSRTVGIK